MTHTRKVQPLYVVDPPRPSASIEIETTEAIRALVAQRDASAAKRILPLVVHRLPDIPADDLISTNWRRLREGGYLGEQYEWLSRLTKHLDLEGLELCVHRDDKAHAFLEGNVVRDGLSPPDDAYRLSAQAHRSELAIFSRFTFPLFDMTKIEMGVVAAERGFGDVMEATWFCHTPTRRKKPCGICAPCRYTREEGLGRRLPQPNSFVKILRRVEHKARRSLIRFRPAS